MTVCLLGTLAASALTSCGGNDGKLVGITYYNMGDNNMKTYWQPTYEEQAKKYGWTIMDVDGASQTDKILKGVQDFIAAGVEGLAINLNKPTDGAAIMELAKEAELPIVFWNKEIADSQGNPDKVTMDSWFRGYFVGTDATQAGMMQAEQYFEYMQTKADGSWDLDADGKVNVLTVLGEEGHVEAEARSEYSVSHLVELLNGEHDIKNKSGVKVTGADVVAQEITGINDTSAASWDLTAAAKHFSNYINDNGKVDVIFSNNDDMAVGIIGTNEYKSTMAIYGVDCSTAGIAAVKDGTLYGSVLNDSSKQGTVVADLLNRLMLNTDTNKANSGDEAALKKLDAKSLQEVIDEYKNKGVTYDSEYKAFRVDYVKINKDNIDQYVK